VYLVSACNRAEYAGEWRINAASVSWERAPEARLTFRHIADVGYRVACCVTGAVVVMLKT
jgi:hypothetical protein